MTEIVIERAGYDIGAALKKAKTRPDYYQESILLEVARRISNAMDEQEVSRADLARKLNVSPAYVTKILRGHENFSLQTLARIAFVLESRWEFLLVNRRAHATVYDRKAEERPARHARVAEKKSRAPYHVGRKPSRRKVRSK